ncbi:MAG: YHS domain-containing protein [Bacteroidota bacterium]
MEKDPVCGMQIDVALVAGKSVYKGRAFYFCASGCKKMFDAAPDKYITGNDGKDHPNAFDPVCGTKIDNITTAERGEHAGKTYYFCCLGCKQLFNTIPEMYEGNFYDDSVNQQQPNQ